MSFSPSSFFAGVGTVIATIAVGFGGGILMTDAFVGNSETQRSKLEQWAARPNPPPQAASPRLPAGTQAAVEQHRQPTAAVQAFVPVEPTQPRSLSPAPPTIGQQTPDAQRPAHPPRMEIVS